MSQTTIQKFLKKNRETKKKIALIGDAMVDEYHAVSVNRISPEFPMPIMWSPKNSPIRRPGGVANVACQFRHFNVDAKLFTFSDPLLDQVLEEHSLSNDGLNIDGLVPVKSRFLDGEVQVVRWDCEDSNYGMPYKDICDLQRELKTIIRRSTKDTDVVILSDYNKGFFDEGDWTGLFQNSFTIVDPKDNPLERWMCCDVFKPNYNEAVSLTGGITDWKDQVRYFESVMHCNSVVITFGDKGVKGKWDGSFFEYYPCDSVKAASVVGAGDCFCAGLAMAVSHGFSGLDAVEIAYKMGAKYVQRGLNRPIVPAELVCDKIVEPEDLANRDFKLSFTNGCFDILHEGHLETLKFSKSKGDKLVVALNSDESVRRLKGESRPIKDLRQRMKLMAAFEFVDFVISFDEDTPQEVMEKIKPDVLVKGSQYELKNIIGADDVPEVYRAPMVEGLSTTLLIGK